MSAREQALPEALEEAVREIAPDLLTAAVDSVGGRDEDATKVADWILSALRAAMPAIRRELLAEVESEPATAERVEAVVRESLDALRTLPTGGRYAGADIYPVDREEASKAVSAALRRLHFGAVAGEVRARRALEGLLRGCPTAEKQAELRYGPEWRERVIEQALATAPPDAALAELLGLPGKLRKEAGELVRPGPLLYAANLLAEALARLGLPAGEEAGDG